MSGDGYIDFVTFKDKPEDNAAGKSKEDELPDFFPPPPTDSELFPAPVIPTPRREKTWARNRPLRDTPERNMPERQEENNFLAKVTRCLKWLGLCIIVIVILTITITLIALWASSQWSSITKGSGDSSPLANRSKREVSLDDYGDASAYIAYVSSEAVMSPGNATVEAVQIEMPAAFEVIDGYKEAVRSALAATTADAHSFEVQFALHRNGTDRYQLVCIKSSHSSVGMSSHLTDAEEVFVYRGDQTVSCAKVFQMLGLRQPYNATGWKYGGAPSQWTPPTTSALDTRDWILHRWATMEAFGLQLAAFNRRMDPAWQIGFTDIARRKRCTIFIIAWGDCNTQVAPGVTKEYVDQNFKSLAGLLAKQSRLLYAKQQLNTDHILRLYNYAKATALALETASITEFTSLRVAYSGYMAATFQSLRLDIMEKVKLNYDLRVLGKIEFSNLPEFAKQALENRMNVHNFVSAPLIKHVSTDSAKIILLVSYYASNYSATLHKVSPRVPAIIDGRMRMPYDFEFVHDGDSFYEPTQSGILMSDLFANPLGIPPTITKRQRVNGITQPGYYAIKATSKMPRIEVPIHEGIVKDVCIRSTSQGRTRDCDERFVIPTLHYSMTTEARFHPGTVPAQNLPDVNFADSISSDMEELVQESQAQDQAINATIEEIQSWTPSGISTGTMIAFGAGTGGIALILVIGIAVCLVIIAKTRSKGWSKISKVALTTDIREGKSANLADIEETALMDEYVGKALIKVNKTSLAKYYQVRATNKVVIVQDPINIGVHSYAAGQLHIGFKNKAAVQALWNEGTLVIDKSRLAEFKPEG